MLTSSSEEATAIYEKFQYTDIYIQFKTGHPDNTGSRSLQDSKMQITSTGKIYTSFYRKPTTKKPLYAFQTSTSTQCQNKLH